jgi:hypothetical protein
VKDLDEIEVLRARPDGAELALYLDSLPKEALVASLKRRGAYVFRGLAGIAEAFDVDERTVGRWLAQGVDPLPAVKDVAGNLCITVAAAEAWKDRRLAKLNGSVIQTRIASGVKRPGPKKAKRSKAT